MSTAHFPCERCNGSGLAANGLVCTLCNGKGYTIPVEGTNDAIRDWEARNLWVLIVAFALAIWAWLGPVRRWAFGEDKK